MTQPMTQEWRMYMKKGKVLELVPYGGAIIVFEPLEQMLRAGISMCSMLDEYNRRLGWTKAWGRFMSNYEYFDFVPEFSEYLPTKLFDDEPIADMYMSSKFRELLDRSSFAASWKLSVSYALDAYKSLSMVRNLLLPDDAPNVISREEYEQVRWGRW